MLLDCYEFCTEEYKKELDGPRAAAAAIDSRRIEASRASKSAVGTPGALLGLAAPHVGLSAVWGRAMCRLATTDSSLP